MTHSRGTFVSWMWNTFPSCLDAFPLRFAHFPPLRQEELEFAIMRIEALKLARQITLAARSRQDTKVPVCCCRVLPLENVVWSRSFFANHGQAGVRQSMIFQKATSVICA